MFSWRLAGAAAVLALLNVQMTTCRSPGQSGGETKPGGEPVRDVNLKQVDTSSLTPREKRLWSEQVSELLSPCADQPVTLAQCVQENRPCRGCVPAARFVKKSITRGFSSEQVELTYRARFAPDQVKKIDVAGSPATGAKSPVVTIVEWADFECPACMAAHPVLAGVLKSYPETVRLVFKHFPLSAHENAELAARSAVAADKQGKFWQMHDALFDHGAPLKRSTIDKLAKSVGLDMKKFEADVESEATADTVARDRKQGDALDLHGTPTLFIDGRRFVYTDFQPDLNEWIELEFELKTGQKPKKTPPSSPAAPGSSEAAPGKPAQTSEGQPR